MWVSGGGAGGAGAGASVGRAVGRVPTAGGEVFRVKTRPLRGNLLQNGGRGIVRHDPLQQRGGHGDDEHRHEGDHREPPHEGKILVRESVRDDLVQVCNESRHRDSEKNPRGASFKSRHDLGPPEASHVLTTSFVYRERLHL